MSVEVRVGGFLDSGLYVVLFVCEGVRTAAVGLLLLFGYLYNNINLFV